MTMTAAVMRRTAAATRKRKSLLPRRMVIPTVIIWRVRRARTVSLLTQAMKKREMKEMRSRIKE